MTVFEANTAMKTKSKIIIAALGLTAFIFNAQAGYKTGYYDQMEGKSKAALKSAAKACVTNHTRLDYYGLPDQWQFTDVYPELVNGAKRWWDMYTDAVELIKPGESARSSFSRNGMNREHSVPKSWWKKGSDVEYTPAYSDLWNLYPSEAKANSAKLNYPLGMVKTTTFDNGCTKVGYPVNGSGGGSDQVFEPADQYKGDFARGFFYMATVYDDLPWVYDYMYTQQSYPTLRPWAIDMLLQWCRQDPVSQKEIDRNDQVEKYQGNRNPFVDFPELAEYIWGTRTMETFVIAQQGGPTTPPVTGDPFLTKPENGMALNLGQAAVGQTTPAYLEIQGGNFREALSLRISGADQACFRLQESTVLPSTLNAGRVFRLPVLFTPDTEGQKQARLVIYDGGLSSSITVTLQGEGVIVETPDAPVALPASDVSATSYIASWQAVPQIVDTYTLTRVRYYGDEVESEVYTTPELSLRITDRDPNVAESYTVTASRLGVESVSSNSITVAADTGVGEIEEQMVYPVATDGGILFMGDFNQANVQVYNLTGAQVISKKISVDEIIMLPTGVYVIQSRNLAKPVKILVK